MPPQSRGSYTKAPGAGFTSQSTPALPTLRTLSAGKKDHSDNLSPKTISRHANSPSDPASLNDFSLDATQDSINGVEQARKDEDRAQDEENSEEESDSEEDEHLPSLPQRTLYNQHSRSHTYLASAAFAPPFYNRPPTPLPPSPSLTSLLRPNFSSTTSRPTTPDPSSDEDPHHAATRTGTQTPNSTTVATSTLTSAYRTAKPIPRASPKVPTYEYYGFTLYLTSSLAFIVYLLWAFLPSPFLHQLGIYYYPNRWWALAVPAWVVMGVVYIYVALAGYNTGYLTLPLRSMACLVDEAGMVAVVDSEGRIVRGEPSWVGGGEGKGRGKGRKGGRGGGRSAMGSRQNSFTGLQGLNPELDWRTLWNEGTDAVMDIPIGGVCEILYGAGRETGNEDGIELD